jgi:hypothetical protein
VLAARAVARIALKTLTLEGARRAAAARERVARVREAPAEVRSYIHAAEVRSYIQVCVWAARERVAGVREAPAQVRSYIHTAEVRSYIQVCVRLRQRSGPMHAAALVYQCMRL